MGAVGSVPGGEPRRKPVSSNVSLLSVFHPFPLRIDSSGEGSLIQYDACLQIGEFTTENRSADKMVIFIPLKGDANPGEEAKFINAFANKIPNILGAQPDRLMGYPDVPAATGSDWAIAKVLKTDRSYYTWVNADGTRVIVMAEPIFIAQADLTNIQRLPITPPEDVIHEIGDVRYKAAPPIDSRGNPVPCEGSKPVRQLFPGPTSVAKAASANKPAVSGTDWLAILLGILGSIVVLLGVWFGLKMAMGPGGAILKSIGDSLGKSLAGGYGAIRNARASVASTIGVGARPVPATSRRTTRRNPPGGLTIRTPAQVAQASTPAGTPAAISNISPANIPEPTGTMVTNPLYKNLNDFSTRQKGWRNTRRSVPGSKKVTLPTVQQVATATEPFPDTPPSAAEVNRLAQPAGTGLFDLGTPAPPRRRRVIAPEPEETSEERIERLAKATALPRRMPAPASRGSPSDPTKVFGSEAIRKRYGIDGGKRKRKNRLKTGRKV